MVRNTVVIPFGDKVYDLGAPNGQGERNRRIVASFAARLGAIPESQIEEIARDPNFMDRKDFLNPRLNTLDTMFYAEDELALRRLQPNKTIGVFGEIPEFCYQKSISEVLENTPPNLEGKVNPELLDEVLDAVVGARTFEKMLIAFKEKKEFGEVKKEDIADLSFPTHLSVGQEVMAAGAIYAINPLDRITSTHRGHSDSYIKGHRYIHSLSVSELQEFIRRDESIMNRLGLDPPITDKKNLIKQALDIHMYRMICEVLGKKDGWCGGKGGGMHIAWVEAGLMGANAIVGGSLGIAAGSGIASRYLKDGKVTLAIAGDGAYNNGIAPESMTLATMGQWVNGMMQNSDPVRTLYVPENNNYAMSSQQALEVTNRLLHSHKYSGFMPTETVFGMNLMSVMDGISRGVSLIDIEKTARMCELWGYRFTGHSLSDDIFKNETYRTMLEWMIWKEFDCISLLTSEMKHAGLITEDSYHTKVSGAEARVKQLARIAMDSDWPDAENDMTTSLYTDTKIDITSRIQVNEATENLGLERDGEGRMSYPDALREGLFQAFQLIPEAVYFGEDVAEYGGAFGLTKGFLEALGRNRIFNTALCEAGTAGIAAGMAMNGMRPVAEIMYNDFIMLAMDQICNQAAKFPYMTDGQLTVPAVYVVPQGGGLGYAGQHSQILETLTTHFPGLIVMAPSLSYHAKGGIIAAIASDNPVIFFPHQNPLKKIGARTKDKKMGPEPVPIEPYEIEVGRAQYLRRIPLNERVKPGKAITMVSWLDMMYQTLDAADRLAEEGYQVEVIDPITLSPFDMDTVNDSIRRTGRLLIAQQACKSFGVGAEIIASAIEHRGRFKGGCGPLDYFDVEPVRVCALDCVPPSSVALEKGLGKRGYLPNAKDIYNGAKKILASN